MDKFSEFLGVSAAIIAATGLAMSLEWLALSGFMRLMALHRKGEVVQERSTAGGRSERRVRPNRS